MPVSGPALAALIQSNIDSRMAAIAGHHPLAQPNPSYFIQMCTAIGTGIVLGSPVLNFTTTDSGLSGVPPVPGVGAGVGIVTDPTFFIGDLYTRIRGYVLAQFGHTAHEPFPPSPGNSGEYLEALCQGINDAFISYYATAWTLVSAHPLIYMGTGTVSDGNFAGVIPSSIKSQIISLSPTLQGSFWPMVAQAISESYADLIQLHSTATVTITGACIPSITQVCAVPSVGAGTGTAT